MFFKQGDSSDQLGSMENSAATTGAATVAAACMVVGYAMDARDVDFKFLLRSAAAILGTYLLFDWLSKEDCALCQLTRA